MSEQNIRYFKDFLAVAQRVPAGRVVTYGDIAYAAGHPGMARQVAWALRAGDADIPWQRVVGAGGKILLTGEFGFEQRLRLQAEGVPFRGLRVDLERCRHSFFSGKNTSPSQTGAARKARRR